MNLFGSRKPKTSKPRLNDPIAQAMLAADRRSADVMWVGGVTFRKNGGAR